MTTNVTGISNTGNILLAKQIIDMSNDIALLNPSATPFILLLKQIKNMTKVAENKKFDWLEDDVKAVDDAINMAGGALAADTKLIVDTGALFRVGDIVQNKRTHENMYVSVINPDGDNVNELTFVRGHGEVSAAAINDNDGLKIIGNVNAEGSGTREIKSTEPEDCYNYTQIFKTPFGVTNTANATGVYGSGDELSQKRNKAGIEHLIDIGNSFYFGHRKEDAVKGNSMRGVFQFCTENNYAAGGTLTQANFNNLFCKNAFLYGGDVKILFADATLVSAIDGWALGKLQVSESAKAYGLRITEYMSPFGVLNIVYDKVLNNSGYNGVILDINSLKYRPLKGRDTKLETNIQDNGEDMIKEQYITECGLELRNPKKHAVITGVTG